MGVEFDFSDVDDFIQEGRRELINEMSSIGKEAVQHAVESGDYQNHTYVLRSSNDFEADETGLTLKNEADYASYVEKKGYEVLSGSALFAEKRLKEELE